MKAATERSLRASRALRHPSPRGVSRTDQNGLVSDDVLNALIDRLASDLRTRFPEIFVRLAKDEEGVWSVRVLDGLEWWGEASTWFNEDDELSPEESERLLADITFNVADNLWPDELTDAWPLCPQHGDHPLNPDFVAGKAAWVCLQDRGVLIPVGDLGKWLAER